MVSNPITPRQLEVLQCAAQGLGLRQTADKLWIVPQTVKFHRTQILYELQAKNITHAVAIGFRKGILK